MKLKKISSVFLASVMLCASVAGCTGNSQKVEIKEPEGELSVYYVTAKSPAVRQMLDSFKTDNPNIKLNVEGFFTAKEMDNRLSTELTSGKGPDVMIFDTSTSMDLTKMMAGNNLMDVKPWLEKDETFNKENYYNVLSAGEYKGKQTVMPIAFNIMYGLTTEENLEMAGIDIDTENLTFTDCLEAAEKSAEFQKEGYLGFLSSEATIPALQTMRLIQYSGYELVDVENKSVNIPEDFKKIADISKKLYEKKDEYTEFSSQYSQDYIGLRRQLF